MTRGPAADTGPASEADARLASERLAAARVWLTARYPYLALAAHSLHPVLAPGLGTFAVDRWWRLYTDPARLAGWTVPQAGAVLVHEVWHLLGAHADRADALGVTAEHAAAWNLAADAEINDGLLADGLPLPGTPVTPERLGCRPGGLAESYYRPTRTPAAVADCGSGAHGVPHPGEQPPTEAQPGTGATGGGLIRLETARQIADAAGRVTVPAGLARWAEGLLTPKVDWRVLLRAAVRGGLRFAAGHVDHSYHRPPRRSAATPAVVLPVLRRPQPTVAVVLDTSASISDGMLAQALTEVDAALRSAAVRGSQISVLCCDAVAGTTQQITAAARITLTGGGGTDLRVGLTAALTVRPRPDLVIVLTDGDTPWPAQPPPATRVIVVLLAPTSTPTPAWATAIPAYD